MDDELLELQRQFEFAQQAKSSIRLSERNVVELVQKLHELHIIDFELLHTVSGKEYITPEQLRNEILAEIKRLGRASLIDLADTTGVDLYHVEKQAQHVITENPGLMLVQGEIISQSYWDTVAEEINERLQECSQIAMAELAAQLHVGSELIASVLVPRLGTLVQGRLEGGQLYTPSYVARLSSMVRGAARGITVPTNLSVLWSLLQQLLQEMDGTGGVAVEGSLFQSLFNALVKDGEIFGSLRAGVHWTPAVFAVAQKECVDAFFSQNSFISYEVLNKLGIPQPAQFLQSRYLEGIPLANTFVHPSMIEMLDAATEDALERGGWSDSLSLLPTSFTPQDASEMLTHCKSVQLALKSDKALIFGDFYVFSSTFVKDLCSGLEKEMETISMLGPSKAILSEDSDIVKETKVGGNPNKSHHSNEIELESGNVKQTEKGSKRKKGKSAGNSIGGASESVADHQEQIPAKSKKSQRKWKDTSSQITDSKQGSKRESVKTKDDNLYSPSEEWIVQKITNLIPDFEEQGINDLEIILNPLANYLRPIIVNSLKEKRKALFTQNSERVKKLLDNLHKKLDETSLNLQLYEKALELFENDQSNSVVLHRHLLRTTASSMVDIFLYNMDIYNKLKNGHEVQKAESLDSIILTPPERVAYSKNLPGALSRMALAVVEALEGKRVDAFTTAFRGLAEESGMFLKKLDKKLERTLLHSYRKDLTTQVSEETDPISLLPKVVSLLYVQIHHKALQAPGRAISVAISHLKAKLDESSYKILTKYQSSTVTLLASLSAAKSEEEDHSRTSIKKELLEMEMPLLKSLVMGATTS